MTAAIQTQSLHLFHDSAVNWPDWIELNEAAVRLDRDPGHLRRTAADQLQGVGRAMKCRGPEGGPARWWIHRSYHVALGDDPISRDYVPPDLAGYTERQVRDAQHRVYCVKRLWHAREHWAGPMTGKDGWLSRLVEQLRQDGNVDVKVSARTLRRWDQLYSRPADIVKLIDSRGGQTRGEPDPAAWTYFMGLAGTEQRRKITTCYQLTCHEARMQGWTWFTSYHACRRHLRSKVSPAKWAAMRNRTVYRNQFSPYLRTDIDSIAPGTLWVGDHCVLDLWCWAKGELRRPWLTAWQDRRTRRIVGWVLSLAPNSETIRAALAKGLLDPANKGGPDRVHIDNGRDYANRGFHGMSKAERRAMRSAGELDRPMLEGLFGLLDMQAIFAQPYNSKAKGSLEQWFDHGLHEPFDKSWPSYAGNKPENRPTYIEAMKRDGVEVPAFEEIEAALAEHIAGFNATWTCEDMKGATPDQMMATAKQRIFADPSVLEWAVLRFTAPQSVTRRKGGVAIDVAGRTLRYGMTDQRVRALMGTGQQVRVGYREDDLSRVWVFRCREVRDGDDVRHEHAGLLCVASANAGGTFAQDKVSREDVREANRAIRKAEAAEQVVRSSQRLKVTSPYQLAAENARRARQTPDRPERVSDKIAAKASQQSQIAPHVAGRIGDGEGASKLVRTPFDGQSRQAQAEQFRQAAGAETDRHRPPRSVLPTGPLPSTRALMEGARPASRKKQTALDRLKKVPAMPSLARLNDGGRS